MDSISEKIGKRLTELRKSIKDNNGHECSQDKIIELLNLGFTQNTLSKIERGKQECDLDTLVKYSRHFNISLDELITGENYIEKPDTEPEKKSFADIVKAFDVLIKNYLVEIATIDNKKCLIFKGIDPGEVTQLNLEDEILNTFLEGLGRILKANELARLTGVNVYNIWLEKFYKLSKGYSIYGRHRSGEAIDSFDIARNDYFSLNPDVLPFD